MIILTLAIGLILTVLTKDSFFVIGAMFIAQLMQSVKTDWLHSHVHPHCHDQVTEYGEGDY